MHEPTAAKVAKTLARWSKLHWGLYPLSAPFKKMSASCPTALVAVVNPSIGFPERFMTFSAMLSFLEMLERSMAARSAKMLVLD